MRLRGRWRRLLPISAVWVLGAVGVLAFNWNRTTGCVDWAARLSAAEHVSGPERTDRERYYAMADAAKGAVELGQIDKAEWYASELLRLSGACPRDWNYGNALHDGHMVLGRVAVLRGRLNEASNQLLEAGLTPGSPQLDSFGPNMSLALDLCRRGRRAAVRQYFQECSRFWKLGSRELRSWEIQTKFGITPNFGANLLY